MKSGLLVHSSTFILKDSALLKALVELAVALLVELEDFLPTCTPVVTLNHVLSEDIFVTILGVFEKSNSELFEIEYFAVQSTYLKSSITKHGQYIYGFLLLANC